MSNFMGDRTPEKELSFKLGIIAYRTLQHAVVENTGKMWIDRETKDAVLKLSARRRGEYSQNDVRRLGCLVTGIRLDRVGMTRRAI